MELQKYLLLLLRYKKMILCLVVITTVICAVGALVMPDKYKAYTKVLVKPQMTQVFTSMSTDTSQQSSIPTSAQHITNLSNTFSEILRGDAIAEKVVDELELGSRKQSDENLLQRLSRRGGDLYRGGMSFLVYGKVIEKPPREKAKEWIQKVINPKLVTNTYIMEISFKAEEPELAAQVANSATKEFVEYSKIINSKAARTEREFLENQILVAQDELTRAQELLFNYGKEVGFVSPTKRIDLDVEAVVQFETDVLKNQAQIVETRKRLQEIRQEMGQYQPTITSTTIGNNPLVDELKSQIVNLELQIKGLEPDYGPLHPQRVSFEKQIEKAQVKLKEEVQRVLNEETSSLNPIYQDLVSKLVGEEANLQAYQAKDKALLKIVNQLYPEKMEDIATVKFKYANLEAAEDRLSKNLDNLYTKLQDARLNEAKVLSEFEVIEWSPVPKTPSGLPFYVYPILGFITAFMSGTGLAVLRDHLDNSIRGAEVVEEEMQMPVYGIIPYFPFKEEE